MSVACAATAFLSLEWVGAVVGDTMQAFFTPRASGGGAAGDGGGQKKPWLQQCNIKRTRAQKKRREGGRGKSTEKKNGFLLVAGPAEEKGKEREEGLLC